MVADSFEARRDERVMSGTSGDSSLLGKQDKLPSSMSGMELVKRFQESRAALQ